MRAFVTILGTFMVLIIGCTNENGGSGMNTGASIGPKYDTLWFNEKCAVFLEPDSIAAERWKEQIDTSVRATVVDDLVFYTSDAHHYLDSMGVKTIRVSGRPLIGFKSTVGSHVIKIDTLSSLWSVLLFDPTKQVKEIDVTDIVDEYESYYKN